MTLSCQRPVEFLSTDPDELFEFEVTGPRKAYQFSMDLQDEIVLGEEYQSIKFKMTPRSTYIGLDEEELTLRFDVPKIVTPGRSYITIANQETSITIYDTSDAVPEDVDSISKSLGYVVGLGSLASLLLSFLLNIIFGGKFNLGWGLINCVQLAAFIPLANFYFPGNVRGFVAILKEVNTAGSQGPNLFYTLIDRSQLEMDPFNYRFEVMGINTTVFIENCGPQLTIFCVVLVLIQVAFLLKKLIKAAKVENRAVKWMVKKFAET